MIVLRYVRALLRVGAPKHKKLDSFSPDVESASHVDEREERPPAVSIVEFDVREGILGLSLETCATLNGVRVVRVRDLGVCAKAGVALGDVIVAVWDLEQGADGRTPVHHQGPAIAKLRTCAGRVSLELYPAVVVDETHAAYFASARQREVDLLPKQIQDPRQSPHLLAERVLGWVIVTTAIVALSYVSHRLGGVRWGAQNAWCTRVCYVLGYAHAVVAYGLLVRLQCYARGSIERSVETCFPLPEAAAGRSTGEWAASFADVDPWDRSRQKEYDADGRIYCTRCFVWRPLNAKTHHCRLCAYCVADGFDHHCGLLGRCIAASNVRMFGALPKVALSGFLTCVAAVCSTAYLDHDSA